MNTFHPAGLRIASACLVIAFGATTGLAQSADRALSNAATSLAGVFIAHELCGLEDLTQEVSARMLAAKWILPSDFAPSGRGEALMKEQLGRLHLAVSRDKVTECPVLLSAIRPFTDPVLQQKYFPEFQSRFRRVTLLVQTTESLDTLREAERLLADVQSKLGPDNSATGFTLWTLGVLKSKRGDFDGAIEALTGAWAQLEKFGPPGSVETVKVQNDLAETFQRAGKRQEAEAVFRRVVEAYLTHLGPAAIETRESQLGLANALADQGKFGDAETLYRNLISPPKQRDERNNALFKMAILNYGVMLGDANRLSEAIRVLDQAISNFERSGKANESDLIHALIVRGKIKHKNGNYAASGQDLRRAAQMLEKNYGPTFPATADAYDMLGRLSALDLVFGKDPGSPAALDRYIEYRKKAAQAAMVNSRYRTKNGNLASAAEAYNDVTVLDRYLTALALVFRTQGERFSVKDEALRVIQQRLQSSTSIALDAAAARLSNSNTQFATLLRNRQDLVRARAQIEGRIPSLVSNANDAQRLSEFESESLRLAQNQKQLEQLTQQLKTVAPDFQDTFDPAILDAKQLQSALGSDEAVLIFHDYEGQLLIFAITNDRFELQTKTKFDEKEPYADTFVPDLHTSIRTLRRGLSISNSARQFSDLPAFDFDLAHKVYRLLFGPVEHVLKGKKKLYIVPVGTIASLPFNVLVTSPSAQAPNTSEGYREAHWLIRNYAITVMPSLTALTIPQLAQAQRAKKSIIAFGNPAFSGADAVGTSGSKTTNQLRAFNDYWNGRELNGQVVAESLPALPETETEVRSVAALVGGDGSRIFTGGDATEQQVRGAALSDFRIVYFATHGLVAGDLRGLGEPALALAKPEKPSGDEDGFLTASKIATLRLNADWVVLSACNTAAGGTQNGEALSGLVRAFFYAGARSVLASHWPVASQAAVKLTTNAFAALALSPKIGQAEALRQSMLLMLSDTGNDMFAHPAIWAPFILVGGKQ